MECRLDLALLDEILIEVRLSETTKPATMRDLLTRVRASRDDVEAALVHLVNRGVLVREKPKRRPPK